MEQCTKRPDSHEQQLLNDQPEKTTSWNIAHIDTTAAE